MSNSATAVNNLNETIGGFKSKVDVKIGLVHTSTDNIRATTDKIFQAIERFKSDMLQHEEKQIAHENILRIDQIIKERFSNHATIRKTIIGIVKDFDINLVRNTTVQELSEELWITSSRYWLSYALIAITAWVNDFPEVAKNALAECGRKDRIKTTLFFCLMNLRFNRMEIAKMWFQEYLRTLDPTILQQETAVLLQSFLNGIFGKDKELEHEVIELIDDWITQINENAEISGELVDAYEKYIADINAPAAFDYPSIMEFCKNAPQLQQACHEAAKYDILIRFVQSLDVESEGQTDLNYKNRVDAILTTLVSNYDAEELELKNQQDYYRCIVENDGVVEKAEEQYQHMQELQHTDFNFGKQMIKWAVYDDEQQTNIHVRKFAFINTKPWFKKAITSWSAKIRQLFPTEYNLKIDKWEGASNGDDEVEQTENMKQFFENNKIQMMYVNVWNILAGAVLLISGALAFATLYALIFSGLAIGFLAYRVIMANKTFPARVSKALGNLNKCMAQLGECRHSYEENMGKKEKLLSMVEFL